MIQVQGAYLPSGVDGFFFLWAIDPDSDMPAKRRANSPHPQALPNEHFYPLLRGLPYAQELTCVILFPDGPAKVPGVALHLVNAIQWLLDLDRHFTAPGLAPGQSLRAWSTAAKLLLEWLGRGRALPLLRTEAGCLTAAWQFVPPEPEDAIRLAQLEAAIPDLCRAIVPPDRNPKSYKPDSAGALLEQFFRAGLGSLAHLFAYTDYDVPQARESRSTAAHHWVLGLTGFGKRDLPVGLPDARVLYDAVDEWAAPVSGVRGHGALKTGLRLHLPEETESGEWEVELVLRSATDPPVTVPASAAWAGRGGEIEIGGQRYQQPEQRLLADLPTMTRLYPPLEPLRFAAAPDRMPVDEAAVMQLLMEGAHLLQEADFPVLLPTGLVKPAALKARLNLKAPAGESLFGLNQLVNVDWELALGDVTLTYDELRRLARQKRPLVQFRGRWVPVDQQTLSAALRNLEPYHEQITVGQALRLAATAETDDAALAIAGLSGEGAVADLLARLEEPGRVEPVPVPAGFVGTLRPYQERGLAWLAFLRRYGLGGCLADDMGLGKTIQLIALLLHEREQGWTDLPTLLVCPVSVAGNWQRELARFAPGLKVMIHHGGSRATEASFQSAVQAHDVIITTYSLVGRDEEALNGVTWAGVVADEAQNIKNPTTKAAQALRKLPAGYRIALTGTPVENHLGDLWSLFAFLNPGFLGSQEEFRRSFAIPIERYRDQGATDRLRRLIQPLMLRRLKTDPSIIDDLPEKQENPVYTNLTVEQAALYEAVVEETLERAANAEGIRRHGAVLTGLMRLKQVCNHPAQLQEDAGPLGGRSGKLDRLVEMLEEVLAEDNRALIFTQFAQFGDRLRQYLARQLGCTVLFLDGSTPREERERLVSRFQAGEAPLFVLSLKAGGVGLNLTAANHVFHFDRWWNPAVEDQATDRAYRIGQARNVLVHKLITAGTLEERIDQLLEQKRSLSEQVVGAGEGWLGSLSNEDLRSLITLQREG